MHKPTDRQVSLDIPTDPIEVLIAEAVVFITNQKAKSPSINLSHARINSRNTINTAQLNSKTTKNPELLPSSIKWNGLLEPLLNLMAYYYQFDLKIIGKPPPIPIEINLSMQNTKLMEVVHYLNEVHTEEFTLIYNSETHVLELIYATKT